ncbi:MAG TPA: polysaccharide biosynthesis tyrosine autokinase [Devosia sp.]|nr:polysaccharide biosynthesis tyrosine autokinase [Devosia sp.]
MEGRELELLGLLRVMRRHAGVIFSSLVIALGLGVLALFLMAPIYSASAVIFVDPAPKNVLASETVLGNDDDARVDSEIELMGTDAVLIRVIDELGLVKDPEFGVKAGIISQLLTLAGMPAPTLPTGSEAVNEVIANVRESLSFQRRGGTYVVGVTAKAPSPEGAARLANSVAGAYIAQQLDAKVGAVLASRNAIEGRMADAAAAVESSETAIDDFIDRQIGLLGASGTTASFLDLRDRVAKLEATTTTGDDAVRQASAALAGEDWDTVLSSLKSQALETLESQRTALARQLSATPREEPTYFNLQEQLAAATERVRTTAQSEIDTLQQSVTSDQRQLGDLRTQLRADVLKGPLPADDLTNLYRLQKSAEGSRTQYSLLLSRISELDAQASLQVADSRIVSPALPPSAPSFPKPAFIIALCLIGGLLIGSILALLVERYLGGFSDEEQLSQYGARRVIAVLPKAGARSGRKFLDNIIRYPASALADSFQRMRVAIEQSPTQPAVAGRGHVVMVSSTAPGEGKSTVAIGLARTFALAGQRTVLIDCDLRRPRVLRYLGMKAGMPLDPILRDTTAPVSPLPPAVTDPKSPVHVMASTSTTAALSSTTTRARLTELIAECRNQYDVVILDTSPIGAVTDAAFIAPLADFVLFVVRWSSTPQREVNKAVAQLESSMPETAELLMVLNGQPATRHSYGGRYSSYYATRKT